MASQPSGLVSDGKRRSRIEKSFEKKVKKVLEDKRKKFYLCIRKTKKRPTEVMGNYKRDL